LFLPKHYEAVANNLLSGERVCWMRLESLMQNLNSIDPVHVRAMKDWGLILPEEQPELGSSLKKANQPITGVGSEITAHCSGI
jgi:hypothetical protein